MWKSHICNRNHTLPTMRESTGSTHQLSCLLETHSNIPSCNFSKPNQTKPNQLWVFPDFSFCECVCCCVFVCFMFLCMLYVFPFVSVYVCVFLLPQYTRPLLALVIAGSNLLHYFPSQGVAWLTKRAEL